MDNQNLYGKDTVQRLYEMIQGKFGDTFTVWPAMALTPPSADEIPLIIIDRKNDRVSFDATETDALNEVIDITVLRSTADAVGGDAPRWETKRNLELFIQGPDPYIQNQYRADTLYSLLRTYITLMQPTGVPWSIDSDLQTVYDTGTLHDGTTNVASAIVHMTVQRRTVVPGRT